MSPFVSKAQAKFMFVHHPKLAKEFAEKTKSIKALPEHVAKKKRSAPKGKEKSNE